VLAAAGLRSITPATTVATSNMFVISLGVSPSSCATPGGGETPGPEVHWVLTTAGVGSSTDDDIAKLRTLALGTKSVKQHTQSSITV
jgi:hypothetical protein